MLRILVLPARWIEAALALCWTMVMGEDTRGTQKSSSSRSGARSTTPPPSPHRPHQISAAEYRSRRGEDRLAFQGYDRGMWPYYDDEEPPKKPEQPKDDRMGRIPAKAQPEKVVGWSLREMENLKFLKWYHQTKHCHCTDLGAPHPPELDLDVPALLK